MVGKSCLAASRLFHFALVLIGAFLTYANAQSLCNPTNEKCPPNPGLATSSYYVDFTNQTELPPDWTLASYETVTYGPTGAEFTFAKRYDAPYMWTSFYFLFGQVEVVMQAAPGVAVISSLVLLSDDLDEIDWEFSGNDFGTSGGKVQTNYYGKGITGNYDRGTQPAVNSPSTQFHTYTVYWTPSTLTWSVDGAVLRTLVNSGASSGDYQFPQSPMQLHLGLWDGGDASTPWYTADWAGGYTNISEAPFTMYVKSVKITNENPCKNYSWNGTSGSYQSIICMNVTSNAASSSASSSASILTSSIISRSTSISKSIPASSSAPASASGSAFVSVSNLISSSAYGSVSILNPILASSSGSSLVPSSSPSSMSSTKSIPEPSSAPSSIFSQISSAPSSGPISVSNPASSGSLVLSLFPSSVSSVASSLVSSSYPSSIPIGGSSLAPSSIPGSVSYLTSHGTVAPSSWPSAISNSASSYTLVPSSYPSSVSESASISSSEPGSFPSSASNLANSLALNSFPGSTSNEASTGSSILSSSPSSMSNFVLSLVSSSASTLLSTATSSTLPGLAPSALPSSTAGAYTVVAGDTGYLIAVRNNITFVTLQAANPAVDWDNLQIGQVLQLFAGSSLGLGSSTSASIAETAMPTVISSLVLVSTSRATIAYPTIMSSSASSLISTAPTMIIPVVSGSASSSGSTAPNIAVPTTYSLASNSEAAAPNLSDSAMPSSDALAPTIADSAMPSSVSSSDAAVPSTVTPTVPSLPYNLDAAAPSIVSPIMFSSASILGLTDVPIVIPIMPNSASSSGSMVIPMVIPITSNSAFSSLVNSVSTLSLVPTIVVSVESVMPIPQPRFTSASTTTSYTVLAGDTGNSIAAKSGTTFDTLGAANPNVNWNDLQIGQIILLPDESEGGQASQTSSSASNPISPMTLPVGSIPLHGSDSTTSAAVSTGPLISSSTSHKSRKSKISKSATRTWKHKTSSSASSSQVAISTSSSVPFSTITPSSSPTPSLTTATTPSSTSSLQFSSQVPTTLSSPMICNQDNCLRNLLEPRYSASASALCSTYTLTTTTTIPTFLTGCSDLPGLAVPSRVSSACSCLMTSEAPSSASSAGMTPQRRAWTWRS